MNGRVQESRLFLKKLEAGVTLLIIDRYRLSQLWPRFSASITHIKTLFFVVLLQFKQPCKMSNLVVTYKSLDHIGTKFASLAYGNCRDLSHFKCFIQVKSQF